MQESAQTAEITAKESFEIEKKQPSDKSAYDPNARNRFEYTVKHKGRRYNTAHVFGSVSDDRFLKYRRDFKIKGDENNYKEEVYEAAARLWEDVIDSVENISTSAEDWKARIPISEKIEAVMDLLAVAVVEDESESVDAARPLDEDDQLVVVTEAFFNGKITRQTHTLRAASFELKKKYGRIQAKKVRQEMTTGLKGKPKIEYVPQDEKIARLYDEMVIGTEGFEGDWVPIRFKTAVIHDIFGTFLDEKK